MMNGDFLIKRMVCGVKPVLVGKSSWLGNQQGQSQSLKNHCILVRDEVEKGNLPRLILQ